MYSALSFFFARKKCLLLNNIFLLSGALLALTSRAAASVEMIILSRVLIGINAGLFFLFLSVYSLPVMRTAIPQRLLACLAGISMNVQPMYFGESAPKHLRGAVSLSCAVFTSFGVVLGQVVGLR